MIRTYTELSQLRTFEERYEYLRLGGSVGYETFGFDRYINQKFYRSKEWEQIRDHIIVRDNGCDLGVEGFEINGYYDEHGRYHKPRIYIHHINPILAKDIANKSELLLDPEYLITTTHSTHNAIHYGDESLLVTAPVERKPNDTCPWKL